MIPSGCTPAALQERIRRDTGTKLHITYIRKIMCRSGLSSKRPQQVYINRAGKKSIQDWQYRLKRRIPCLEGAGFAAAMQDESLFTHDVITGHKYRPPRGQRINAPYTGSHRKVTVYGEPAKGGRQYFRAYDRFSTPIFICCPKEMRKRFGGVTLITDRAPSHRSRLVRKFLRANRNSRILYFPKGSPHLNAVEEC